MAEECPNICLGVSEWTGLQCKAKAVRPYTVKKDKFGNKTGVFLDCRFCQMHQPGRASKKRCVCKHCDYHRQREPKFKGVLPQDRVSITRRKVVDNDGSFVDTASSVTASGSVNTSDSGTLRYCQELLGEKSGFGEKVVKKTRKRKTTRKKKA